MKSLLILIFILISISVKSQIPKIDSIESLKYPEQFLKMMPYILKFEGGWFEEEVTNYGIMQPNYDKYRKKKNKTIKSVKLISPSEVYDLYYTMYYLPGHNASLTPAIAFINTDSGINYGLGGANKLLKQALELNYDNFKWNDSIVSIVNFNRDIPGMDKELAICYVDARITYRYGIVERHPEKKKFLKGWLSRDNQIKSIIRKDY